MSNSRNKTNRRIFLSLAGISLIAGSLVCAFLWADGLIGDRVTTRTFLGDSIDKFPAGYRRAHGKGMCFSGTFRSNGALTELSSARVFAQKEMPVVGRFSIGSGNPHAADNSTTTVSMALMITADDHSQWRMKLNNMPYFPTRDSVGFLAMVEALKPDPETGKPSPEKLELFLKSYPEAQKFLTQAARAPWPGSFSGAEFNVVNSFILVSERDQPTYVRWSMRPHEPFVHVTEEERARVSHDYLFDDLRRRVDQKPLYWDLVMQIADPSDPVNDPSRPWPAERKKRVAGTLEVNAVVDQQQGECRDINFDPTLVPPGIRLSEDPVLAARAGIYSHSYNARLREIGFGKATDAIGKEKN